MHADNNTVEDPKTISLKNISLTITNSLLLPLCLLPNEYV